MPLKVREVIKLLEKNGWRLLRKKGDHRIFGDGEGRTTVISGRTGDDVRPGTYSAYVPELPTILVTGRSVEELTDRATEAIRLYWESVRTDRSPPSTLREIEVEWGFSSRIDRRL